MTEKQEITYLKEEISYLKKHVIYYLVKDVYCKRHSYNHDNINTIVLSLCSSDLKDTEHLDIYGFLICLEIISDNFELFKLNTKYFYNFFKYYTGYFGYGNDIYISKKCPEQLLDILIDVGFIDKFQVNPLNKELILLRKGTRFKKPTNLDIFYYILRHVITS